MIKMNEKKLIALVRKHPELYDVTHEKFSDIEYKKTAWKMISSKLLSNENDCCNTWIDLKFEYQNFVQNLRVWMLKKKKTKRPEMKYEREMIFLWRFISTKNEILLKRKREIPKIQFEEIILESNNLLAVNTKDNNNTTNIAVIKKSKPKKRKQNKRILRREIFKKKLLKKIMYYPELFDTNNPYYNEPTRRGIIWKSIAKEIKANVYKCIHSWFDLKTTYKHYLTALKLFNTKTLKPHKYHKELKFYEKFVNINEIKSTHSFYIWWRRSLNPSTTKIPIQILLKTIKSYSTIYDFDYRNHPVKSSFNIWTSIALKLKSSESICERLFSSLRDTYTEICIINKGEHKFLSKWCYFYEMQNLSRTVYCYSVYSDQINAKTMNILTGKGHSTSTNSYMSAFDNFIKDESSKPGSNPILTDGECIKLINAVKKYPEVHQEQPGNYNAAIWNVIGALVGHPGLLCKKYWSYLAKSYMEQIRKLTFDKNTSQNFRFFYQMLFLSQPVFSKTENIEISKREKCRKPLKKKVIASTLTDFTSNPVTKATTKTSTVPTMQKPLPQISNVFSLSENNSMYKNTPIQPIIFTTTTATTTTTTTAAIATATNTAPPPVHLMPSANVYKIPAEISVQMPCASGTTVTQISSLLAQSPTSGSQAIQPSLFLPAQPSTSASNSTVVRPSLLPAQPIQPSTSISNLPVARPPFLPAQPSTSVSNSTFVRSPFLPAQSSISISNPTVTQPQFLPTQPSTSLSNSTFVRSLFLPAQTSIKIANPTVTQSQFLPTQPSTSVSNSTFVRSPFLPAQSSISISNPTITQPQFLPIQPSTSVSNSTFVRSQFLPLQRSASTSDSAVTIDLSKNELNQNYKVQGTQLLKILKLINVIKKYKVLYDYTHPLYCDQNNAAWQRVSNATDLPVEKCKEIWRTLRIKYWKYLCVDIIIKNQLSDEIKEIFQTMNFLSAIRNETTSHNKWETVNKLFRNSEYEFEMKNLNLNELITIAQCKRNLNLAKDTEKTMNVSLASTPNTLPSIKTNYSADSGNFMRKLIWDLKIKRFVTEGVSMHSNILSTVNRNIFIKNVTNYVHLYCVKHKDYNNHCKKLKSWKEIAFLMNMSVLECRLIWEDMKQVYQKLKMENPKKYLLNIKNKKTSKHWINAMHIMEQCIFNEHHECSMSTNTNFEVYVKELSKLPKKYQLKAFNKIKLLFGANLK